VRVVRSHIGCWLALLALVAQIVLPLTHVHAYPTGTGSHAASVAASPVHLPAAPGLPAGSSDGCVLCALTGLAGPAPVVPQLSPPLVHHRALFDIDADSPLSGSSYRLFQARAPPSA
jgi:hypothetical protein